jgi:hypothetical protein
LICREWEFPEALTAAIEGHHSDDASVPLPAVQLVAPIREVLEQPGIDRLVASAVERHQLPQEQVTELVAASFEDAEEVARMFA